MHESIVGYVVLHVRCRRKESSRSLSHLLMSFFLFCSTAEFVCMVCWTKPALSRFSNALTINALSPLSFPLPLCSYILLPLLPSLDTSGKAKTCIVHSVSGWTRGVATTDLYPSIPGLFIFRWFFFLSGVLALSRCWPRYIQTTFENVYVRLVL